MNIKNLKIEISSEIYSRGEDYYDNGNVTNLKELHSGKWIAEVEGHYDDYNVEVNLDSEGNITDYSCDCPYEGQICKHVVAVLLSILDEYDTYQPCEIVIESYNKKEEWQTVLQNVSDQELRTFVMEFANKNKDFQNEMVIHLSKSQKVINAEKYRQIIANHIDNIAGRCGYISYRDVDFAMEIFDELREKAKDYISKNLLHEAFSIASAIVDEAMNAIQMMDDSLCQCGDSIIFAFELVDEILENCSDEQLAHDIFEWLYKQVQNKDYNEYGCERELESTFIKWANNPSRLDKAYQFIDKQIENLKNERNRSNDYRLTQLLKYKCELLTRNGKAGEAEQIINENLHLKEFRQLKIDEAFAKNDHQSAIAYLTEGIVQEEKDNPYGSSINYKQQLLKIYLKLNDKKNIRKFAKELYFHNFNMDYYRLYKSTFITNEWENELNKIIYYFTNQDKKIKWGYYFSSGLAEIYIEEQLWKPLLDSVIKANRIEITEEYREYLQNNYSQELLKLYYDNILVYAKNTGRDYYINIVQYLTNMAKLDGGFVKAKELKDKLLEIYRNRPAMQDEFRRLNW